MLMYYNYLAFISFIIRALYSTLISLSIHYTSPPPSLTTPTPPPLRSPLPASFLMVIACGSPAGGKAPGPPLPGQPGRSRSLTSLRGFSAHRAETRRRVGGSEPAYNKQPHTPMRVSFSIGIALLKQKLYERLQYKIPVLFSPFQR